MDEPFSALDAITREEMQDVFIDLWQKQKVSTILVTHYVEEALYLGQKIIVMTSAPGGIYKIIDNPLFSDKNFRDREIFSSLSKEIRNYLKKQVVRMKDNHGILLPAMILLLIYGMLYL